MSKPLNVKIGVGLSLLGVALAGTSISLYIRDGLYGITASRKEKAFQLVILCIWIVAPPIWFVIEPRLTTAKRWTEELRKSQEPLSRIWLGVSAMLGVLASALISKS